MVKNIILEPVKSIQVIAIDGYIDVLNLPQQGTEPNDLLLDKLISAVQNADLRDVTPSQVSSSYFSGELVIKNKINDGIVETPFPVANFMTEYALNRWCSRNKKSAHSIPQLRQLSWLDPCSGAGAFPCAILRYYHENLGAKTILNLPKITMVEISIQGLALTLCNLKIELQRCRVELVDYFKSGKLTVLFGDCLDLFPETLDLFVKSSQFDIIVGNPPYVRSSRMTPKYKKKLAVCFPLVYSGGTDLYTYFIASGVGSLKINGVLCFVSPASFSRAKNGQMIRRWLRKNAVIDTYIDLNETKVFEGASVHPAIYVLSKSKRQSKKVKFLQIDNENDLANMCKGDLLPENSILERQADGWSFHSSESEFQSFTSKFSNTKSLRELGFTIYSGIRPGCKDAFIVDNDTFQSFSKEVKEKWFKPVILPSNIKSWHSKPTDHYMLVIPSNINTLSDELMNYLHPFRNRLAKRSEVRNKTNWFALRPCSYYSEMEKRKIIFPDLSARQRFSIAAPGVYVLDGAYFIDTDDLIILAILNSTIAKKYFVKRCSSVGNLSSTGRFRFKKTFLQDFPVPANYGESCPIQNKIRDLTKVLVSTSGTSDVLRELDNLVSEFYEKNALGRS